MPADRMPIITGQVYHVYSKSIAGYKIFCSRTDYKRMLDTLIYYQQKNRNLRFSWIEGNDLAQSKISGNAEYPKEEASSRNNLYAYLICFCLMPTHFHLLIKQLNDKGISEYLGKVLNSYSRYFNTKYKRKGPLWQGRFQRRLIETDEDLLHMTRYIHLNPVTANLKDNPAEWKYSSYNEYLQRNERKKICHYEGVLEINTDEYKEFVEDRAAYQRELARIKYLILDNDICE